MLLYHGSDLVITYPKIVVSNRALDFGRGFYTTLNEQQAQSFARKVQDRNHSDKGVVNVYEANADEMKAELDHLWFDTPDEAWLDFVSDNRNGVNKKQFDFVYGPVANDDVFRTFIAYASGILSKSETIDRLKIKQLYSQLTFISQRSLAYLEYRANYTV